MKNKMKVSIIIPCYNVDKYIEDCFKSIEKQTFSELEVIFVNDGSIDNTVKILENLISSSTLDMRLIHQENKGAPSARNNGIKHCNGSYIQFLDADDILLPNKIKHQINIANENKFPDIIVGSYQRQNMKGDLINERIYNVDGNKNLWKHLMKTDLGNTCSNLFNSAIFKDGIKWTESLKSSQEYNLMFKILKKSNKVIFDSHMNTIIRVRDSGSISQQKSDKKWERYVQLRIDIVDYLKNTNPEIINDEIHQILFSCIRMLYPHNPTKATSYYKEYIPKKFIPRISSTTGKSYVIIYKIFGFIKTERLRQSIGKRKAK